MPGRARRAPVNMNERVPKDRHGVPRRRTVVEVLAQSFKDMVSNLPVAPPSGTRDLGLGTAARRVGGRDRQIDSALEQANRGNPNGPELP